MTIPSYEACVFVGFCLARLAKQMLNTDPSMLQRNVRTVKYYEVGIRMLKLGMVWNGLTRTNEKETNC